MAISSRSSLSPLPAVLDLPHMPNLLAEIKADSKWNDVVEEMVLTVSSSCKDILTISEGELRLLLKNALDQCIDFSIGSISPQCLVYISSNDDLYPLFQDIQSSFNTKAQEIIHRNLREPVEINLYNTEWLDKKLYPHCIKRVFGCTLSPEQELRLSEIFDPNLSDIGKMCLTKDISFGLDFTLSEGVHKEKQEEVLAAFTRFYKEVVVQSVQASTLKNPLLANPDIVNRYLEQFLVPFKEGSSMHKCLEIVFDKRHDSAKKVLGSLGRASGARDTSARLALSFKLEAKKRKKQHDQWTETLNNFRKFASGKSDRELLDPSIAPKDPDLIMAELIAAFADETPSKSKKKKKATTKTESKAQEAPATKAPKKSQPPKTNKQPLEDALISLQRNATNWNHLDSRVGKWGDLSPNAIRAITNCKGDELYAHYTDKEAFETQARHYLRGIQAIILDEQLLNTFTFPTTYHDEGTELQGRGLFAKLHFQGTTEFGIVYLGIDRSQVVYHAFFETELNGKRQSDELLHPRILTHLFQDSIQEKIDPSTWDYVSRTSFSSTEDGSSLQLIQSDHAGQMELCYEFFALR